jgi:hypothetical protein
MAFFLPGPMELAVIGGIICFMAFGLTVLIRIVSK